MKPYLGTALTTLAWPGRAKREPSLLPKQHGVLPMSQHVVERTRARGRVDQIGTGDLRGYHQVQTAVWRA